MADGEYVPPPGASYVLEWNHPDIVPGCPDGIWFLQPMEDFLDTGLRERQAGFREDGIDAAAADLAAWAAGELDCPVRLIQEDGTIVASSLPGGRTLVRGSTRAGRLFARAVSRRELPHRLYWVVPAGD